jgi:hypothetical protein
MEMNPVFLFLDPYLIWFYRRTGHAWVDFFLGTFVLAFIALLIGEITVSLVFLVVRKRIDHAAGEAERYQALSIEALKAGDKEVYKSINKLANEAFGKSFFMQLTLSAAFLWPVPFALAWMQHRFLEVEIPLPFTSYTVGYIAPFIVLYIAAYQIFKRLKPRLPFFRRVKAILDTYPGADQEKAN